MSVWKSDEKLLSICILNFSFKNDFVWEETSNIPHSVSSPDETPRSSSKILRCASYFQLSSLSSLLSSNLHFAQKMLRKAKVAQGCQNRKEMFLCAQTQKVAKKLPSTIETGLPVKSLDDHRQTWLCGTSLDFEFASLERMYENTQYIRPEFHFFDKIEMTRLVFTVSSGAPNVNFREISVRKTISDLEFSKDLL